MSWIIGISGIAGKSIIDIVKSTSPHPLYEKEENGFLIRTGGNPKTCFYPSSDNSAVHTIAVGVGIKQDNEELNFMNCYDWAEGITVEQSRSLNGHFVFFKWNNNEINILTDKLGLRDIYFTRLPGNALLYSTRADWIAKITHAEINFREFGSRWLLFNQISSNSIFRNIERATAGTKVIIDRTNNNITVNKFNWLPSQSAIDVSAKKFTSLLGNLITFPSHSSQNISLGLSGGMDSRVMLSYLLKDKKIKYDTYTFGDNNSPDSAIVKEIILDGNITHEQINMPFTEADDCLCRIKNYVSQTLVNNPVSGFLQLRNYDSFVDPCKIIIDGGFGEIWRREFFNRLLVRGKDSLERNDIKGIMPHISFPRSDIFNSDIQLQMQDGCNEQLEYLINELPSVNSIGNENWADLFAVKTRLTNYYSHEQARLDELVFNYMPFAQPILLEKLLNIPLIQRRNGKLFREIIKNNYNQLAKYPLAKGLITHPFWFNTLQSRAWNIFRKKLKLKLYNDRNTNHLINLLTPFILDTIHSQNTRECNYYNYSKITRLSVALIKGNISDNVISELDWWLAFELFRGRLN
jgi:hypothetical protein